VVVVAVRHCRCASGAGAAVWPERRFLGLFLFLGAVVRASSPVPHAFGRVEEAVVARWQKIQN
jgi:hypothetical protein